MSNEESATEHEAEDEERFEYLANDLKRRQRRRVRNRHVKDLVSRIIARRGFSQQQASEQRF